MNDSRKKLVAGLALILGLGAGIVMGFLSEPDKIKDVQHQAQKKGNHLVKRLVKGFSELRKRV